MLTETAQSEQDGQTKPTEGDDIQPLEEDIISVLCYGVSNTQELTDVIMYAQFDTRSGKVNVLRIPRDTFVGSQFPTAKINAIYGHPEDGKTGIQTLTDYLRDNWKLDIDYYATIDLASVRDIVDDMGGVTMDNSAADQLPAGQGAVSRRADSDRRAGGVDYPLPCRLCQRRPGTHRCPDPIYLFLPGPCARAGTPQVHPNPDAAL